MTKNKNRPILWIVEILFILFIILATITYIYHQKHIVYNNKAVDVMKEQDVYDTIDKESYSKTLEVALESDNFLKEYIKDYEKIEYHEQDNFIQKINTFLNLHYTAEEINKIYAFLNQQNIEKLLTSEKIDLTNYYIIKNFEVDKIARYETYQEQNNCSLEEAVLKVNIGLDHDFYTQINDATNIDDYTVLVNKYHSIGEYEPTDLKSLSYDSRYMLREKAADAFEELVSAAKLEGVLIRPYSAYRSYKYQTSLYNNYVNRDGKEKADTYSARPGHSEHQTGLAVDVWSLGYQYIKDEDADWLAKNSYKYGFIIRYTKENMDITGYIEEPWHLRYLGIDIATDVVEKNLTYDEYYDLYIK